MKFRNVKTGAVIDVPSMLGGNWERIDGDKSPKKETVAVSVPVIAVSIVAVFVPVIAISVAVVVTVSVPVPVSVPVIIAVIIAVSVPVSVAAVSS